MNVCYLVVILIFLVVTAPYLVVTAGYCSLLVDTARYRLLMLVPIFSMNVAIFIYSKIKVACVVDIKLPFYGLILF